MERQNNSVPQSKTLALRDWMDAYHASIDTTVDNLIKSGDIYPNETMSLSYWDAYGEEQFNKGASPEDSGKFAANSLVRNKLINKIREISVSLRTCDQSVVDELNAQLDMLKQRYNALIGYECFCVNDKRPITESAAAPSMMAFGRAYDTPASDGPSVIDRFNAMACANDPFIGGTNMVLARLQEFERNNASKYGVDEDPELDDYVKTLFVTEDDLGPESFLINGENPYRVAEKVADGDPIDLQKSEPVGHSADNGTEPEIDDGFLSAFGNMFADK